jgi:hypothetical protein
MCCIVVVDDVVGRGISDGSFRRIVSPLIAIDEGCDRLFSLSSLLVDFVVCFG